MDHAHNGVALKPRGNAEKQVLDPWLNNQHRHLNS
jgi:hypothetical protein